MPTQVESPSPLPEVLALLDSGRKAFQTGHISEAASFFDQALQKAKSLNDKKGEQDALRGQGNIALLRRDFGPAKTLFEQSILLAQALGDRNGEGSGLASLGRLARTQGDLPKSIELQQQALQIFQQTRNKLSVAQTLAGLGITLDVAGQNEQGFQMHQAALKLAKELGDKNLEAGELTNLGNSYAYQGNPSRALSLYQEALPLHRASGNRQFEANTLTQMGDVYHHSDDPKRARELYEQAIALFVAVEDRRGEAISLQSLGEVYLELGQPVPALTALDRAAALQKSLGSRSQIARNLAARGKVYEQTGQYTGALSYLNQAVALYEELGSTSNQAAEISNTGNIYNKLRKYAQARDCYERALKLHRSVGEKANEANTLTSLGTTYASLGETKKALAYFQQGLQLSQSIGDTRVVRVCQASMALLYTESNQPAKAVALLKENLPYLRAQGNQAALADTLYSLAGAEWALRQRTSAEAHLQEAVQLLEASRAALTGMAGASSSFLATNITTYYTALGISLEMGKVDQAFLVAQKTKARSLLDLLHKGRVTILDDLTEEEQQQEQELLLHANYLNSQMVREGVENEVGSKKRYATLKDQLRETERALQQLHNTFYARHPALASKRLAQTASLADIAKILPADTVLLEFIALTQGKVVVFVADSLKGSLRVRWVLLSLPYPLLCEKARAFHTACSHPKAAVLPLARELYHALITPIAKHLAGKKHLIVCPDGALWDVPFAALHSGKEFLAERFELSYAYSASGLWSATKRPPAGPRPKQNLLVVANPSFGTLPRQGEFPGQRPIDSASRPIDSASRPIDSASRPIDSASRPIDSASRPIDSASRPIDSASRAGRIAPLPGTQREADALKKRFPDATILTGKDAQESSAKKLASQFRYLHFATHGFVNDASPLLSALILAAPPLSGAGGDDGFLTAREVFDLRLSAEMTVLSACNTARGTVRTGDGMIGLTWALFVAGCPTQVVSQWAVDDASTALLMERFYTSLPDGKAAALRKASLSLLQQPKYRHPYYWAPFILMGEGR